MLVHIDEPIALPYGGSAQSLQYFCFSRSKPRRDRQLYLGVSKHPTAPVKHCTFVEPLPLKAPDRSSIDLAAFQPQDPAPARISPLRGGESDLDAALALSALNVRPMVLDVFRVFRGATTSIGLAKLAWKCRFRVLAMIVPGVPVIAIILVLNKSDSVKRVCRSRE